MEIRQYNSGLLNSNMFVIAENGHAIVIDPARDTDPGRDLIIDRMIVTHEHYDHISGVNAWKEKYHAPLLCSAACAERIEDPRTNQARYFISFCQLQSWQKVDVMPDTDPDYAAHADMTFHEETSFSWQGHTFRMIAIPGHSPGSIGIYLDEKIFFSGDSLLEGKEIELRFPGGSRKEWEEKGRPAIEAIPQGTLIYPGHFSSFIYKQT